MPTDDQQRLDALKRFFVLDHTESEDDLTRIVRVAAGLYGVAYAALTLRDGDGERLAAAHGFDPGTFPEGAVVREPPAGPSLPLTVADVSTDARFARNPLVHGPQAARFYAGVPIKSGEGFTLGTLALLDPAPQELNGEGLAMLVDLGALVEPALNLQRARDAQAEAEAQRQAAEAAQQTAEAVQQATDAALQAAQQTLRKAEERHALLEAERDTAHAEHFAVRAEHEVLTAEHGALTAEHEALAVVHDALAAEYEALVGKHEALTAAHDALTAAHGALTAEHGVLAEKHGALAAFAEALAVERDALTEERDALTEERNRLAAERDAARTAAGTAGAFGNGLATAISAAAAGLALDPSAFQAALHRLAPETGATRALLVLKTEAGPTIRAAWHADGAAPLAEADTLLDADALDAWSAGQGVHRLVVLPLPGLLALLDVPAWDPAMEPTLQAAFAPFAVALRRSADAADGHGRSRLLASVSHEVRTALTSILGYAEMLSEESGVDAQRMAATITSSSHRLLQTLDSVLDIARLEAAGRAAALTAVELGPLVEAAAAPYRAVAEHRDLAFFTTGTEGGTYAWADAGALGRVLAHLLANAFTFTDQGGVRLRVQAEDGAVSVEVQDTGVGIAPAFLPHLFDAFRREEAERQRDGKGSGMGLALSRRLVDLMDGEITVTSLKGQGSVFRILLHAAPTPADGASAAPLSAMPAGDGAAGDGFAADVRV